MANEMFGAPVGESQALSDIRQQQLADITVAQGQVALDQAKLNLENQKNMLAMMTQGGMLGQPQAGQSPGGSSPSASNPQSYDLATMMDKLSVLSAASGQPEKAREYAVAGSTMRHQAAQIDDLEFKEKLKHLDMIGSLMEGVHDEATWKQANAMYQLQTGKPTPYAQLPYNPRVVEELKIGVASAKDRATTAAAEARKKASEAAVQEREARVPLIKAQTELARTRTEHLKKTGAIALVPKAGDVKAITDLIIKDYGAGVMPEDARVLARPVAEEMVRLVKTTGLSQSEAANRAYQNAKAAGAFGGLRPRVALSGTIDKPLDLPPPGDENKLKKNMFYKGRGKYSTKVLLWTGSSFVPVGTGPGEISPQADQEVIEAGGEPGDDAEPDSDTDESTNPDDNIPAE